MTEKNLIPIEQKEVYLYDDELIAVRANDGQIYVSVRHLAEALGLTRQSQIRRIERQPILSHGHFKGAMMTPKGKRQANYLRVDLVPLFLTGIDTSRVKEERRSKLERFQHEAAQVLWEAFQEGRLTADPTFDELLATDSPAAQAYKTFQALTKLARSQLILESKVADHEQRLERIEATLGDSGQHILPDEASQISQAVKAVAHAMGGHGKHYQSVYGELYRREGITSYKLLPKHRFEGVMKWFSSWYQDLTNKDLPF